MPGEPAGTVLIPSITVEDGDLKVAPVAYRATALEGADLRMTQPSTLRLLRFAAHVPVPLTFSAIAVGLLSALLGFVLSALGWNGMPVCLAGSAMGVAMVLIGKGLGVYVRSSKERIDRRLAELVAAGTLIRA